MTVFYKILFVFLALVLTSANAKLLSPVNIAKEVIEEGVERVMDPENTEAQKKKKKKEPEKGEQLELPFDEDDDDDDKGKKKSDDDDDDKPIRQPKKLDQDKCLFYYGVGNDGYYFNLQKVLNTTFATVQAKSDKKLYFSKKNVKEFIEEANEAYDEAESPKTAEKRINTYYLRGDEYVYHTYFYLSYKVAFGDSCDVGSQSADSNKRHDKGDDDDDDPKSPKKRDGDDDDSDKSKPKKGSDGSDGKDGKKGSDGSDGKDGKDGKNGKGGDGGDGGNGGKGGKGKDGDDGDDGDRGKRGKDGDDGDDGKDGKKGDKGDDGKDGKDGKDAEPLQMTPFCQWATPVCDFIAWVKEAPPEPQAPTKPLQIDLPNEQKSYVNFSGTCPTGKKFEFVALGRTISYPVNYQPFCDFLEQISLWLVAFTFITTAGMVVRSI